MFLPRNKKPDECKNTYYYQLMTKVYVSLRKQDNLEKEN